MESVERTGPIVLSSGTGSRSAHRGRSAAERDVRALRTAAALALVAFGLVVAAQWLPWFTIHLPGRSGPLVDVGGPLPTAFRHGSISVLDASGLLAIPYYFGWLLVMTLCGGAILGSSRTRRIVVGTASGALAAQSLLVISIAHSHAASALLFSELPAAIRVNRSTGLYCALAALVLFAVAMIVSVRGRILPTREDAAPAGTGEAPRSMTPAGDDPAGGFEDEFDARDRPGVFEAAHRTLISNEPAHPVPVPDHSMYVRPPDARTISSRR